VYIFVLLTAIGRVTHSGSQDEVELIRRIKARDEKALEQLYDLYKRLLYGMILSIVKKREEAEDVLQNVFLKIWNKAHTFDEEKGNVYSWVVTLTRNKAIDHIRSKDYKAQQQTSQGIDENTLAWMGTVHDPLETTIFSDRADLVRRALEELPESQSEVLKIAYYRGMTQPEISRYLGIPLGTVKTRMRQGMLKLKSILQDYILHHG
jgi:RNA polymerase sigma-70 factor (ECF subfamily)